MKHFIIGTAGHVDHGKTTLIKALTGEDTDRLPEEKARKISIDLGFASFELPSGKKIGIVDVPGHEKFIKNMLAGVFGMDGILLVIAADSGLMPQTYEHLNILSYLGIKCGIVALTKCDTLEQEYVDLVLEEIKEELKNSFAKNFPIICVDSVTQKGIDKLKDEIDKLATDIQYTSPSTYPRLYIDKIYSIHGYGTVVSGTLQDGYITVGDEMVVLPLDKSAKVRAIQVHGEDVERAYPSQRTAINLSNIRKDEVHRGDVLAPSKSLASSSILNVHLSLVDSNDLSLTHWNRLRLYTATSEVLCRLVLLDCKELKAKGSAFAQLRLEKPIYVKSYDNFIIRSYSPMTTIGGGKILETEARKCKYGDEATLARLALKNKGDLKKILIELLSDTNISFYTIKNLVAKTGYSLDDILPALEELICIGQVIELKDSYTTSSIMNNYIKSVIKVVEVYHNKHPLRLGMTKVDIKKSIAPTLNPKDFNLFFATLLKEKSLAISNGLVSLAKHCVKLNARQLKIKDELLQLISSTSLSAFMTETALCNKNIERREILMLINKGVARLVDGYYVSTKVYELAVELLQKHFKTHKTISVGEYRDLLGASRRNALILLDTFDKNILTARQGEVRVLLKSNQPYVD